MSGTARLKRSDLANILVYLLLVAVLAGSLFLAWPPTDLSEASTARKAAVAFSGTALAFTLLLGLVFGVDGLRDRRRIAALARILAGRQCRECGPARDADAVERTAHRVEPLCGGDPEHEDLRPRWMVRCASCGAWAGFGDDGEPIDGGVVPVPAP
jgi:hypothetical protein